MNKILSFLKRNLIWIVCILLFIIFMIIAVAITTRKELIIDKTIANFISGFKCSELNSFFKIYTCVASSYFLIALCIITYFVVKNKKIFKMFALNLINTTIICQVLKRVLMRSRPLEMSLIHENGYSFPSGHSVAAMTFYGLLIYLIYKSDKKKSQKAILISTLSLIIITVGISRIYLGVHYATDVIGAFCLTIAYLIIFTRAINKYIK